MPRHCSVCDHPNRLDIDAALVRPGATLRDISTQFEISKSALHRHRAHVSAALRDSAKAQKILSADNLAAEVLALSNQFRALLGQAEGILTEARAAKDVRRSVAALRAACAVGRQLVDQLDLRGRLTGQLGSRGSAAGGPGGLIVVPVQVQIGVTADLRARIPPERLQAMLEAPTPALESIDVTPGAPESQP